MKSTPEAPAAVRQHTSRLPYIPDATEANQIIGQLVAALEQIQELYEQSIKRSRPQAALILINEIANEFLTEARKLPGEGEGG